MTKFTTLINSFKTGKISKKLTHRQDIPALKDSCDTLENLIPQAQGGTKLRYGTNLVISGLNSGSMYPLRYTQKYSYLIYISEVASIFETVTRTINASPVSSSKLIRIFDHTGQEYRVYTCANAPQLNPWYDTAYDAFKPNVVSAFSSLPTTDWQYTQLSRKTVFTHPSGTKMPFVVDILLSSGVPVFFIYPWCFDKELHTRNAIDELAGDATVPFGGVTVPLSSFNSNTLSTATMTTLTGAYTAAKIIKSASSSDKKMFRKIKITSFPQTSNMNSFIGGSIKLRNGSNQDGIYTIVGINPLILYPDTEFYVITNVESTAATFTTDKWAISEWGGILGFPRSVTTFKGRLVFGGSEGRPNTFWSAAINSSNSSSFQNLLNTKLAQDVSTDVSELKFFGAGLYDMSFSASFNEASSGDIKWVRGRKQLHFGTNIGEHLISFIENVFALSNMETSKVTSYASSPVNPVEGDQKIFYLANNRSNLRYISTNDKYSESIDMSLSILNEEYRDIDKIEWCEAISSLIFKTADGTLHSVTVNQQSQVSAFCDYILPFAVKDLTVLNKNISGIDKEILFLHVEMGGLYYVLTMYFDNIDRDTIVDDYHYLDFAQYSVGVTDGPSTFTYLPFADKTVGYYSGGVYAESLADELGQFTIETTIGASIIYGLPYKGKLITSDINEGSKYGQANGLIKRIDRATIYLTKSGKCKVGSNNGSMYPVEKSSDAVETYAPVVDLSNNPDYHIRCIIESLNGTPLNISSIALRGVTYEGE
jgi:hypothetical protein